MWSNRNSKRLPAQNQTWLWYLKYNSLGLLSMTAEESFFLRLQIHRWPVSMQSPFLLNRKWNRWQKLNLKWKVLCKKVRERELFISLTSKSAITSVCKILIDAWGLQEGKVWPVEGLEAMKGQAGRHWLPKDLDMSYRKSRIIFKITVIEMGKKKKGQECS